jgi:hypothetical protein
MFGPLSFTAGPVLKASGLSGVMRMNVPWLSKSGETSAVKSVP